MRNLLAWKLSIYRRKQNDGYILPVFELSRPPYDDIVARVGIFQYNPKLQKKIIFRNQKFFFSCNFFARQKGSSWNLDQLQYLVARLTELQRIHRDWDTCSVDPVKSFMELCQTLKVQGILTEIYTGHGKTKKTLSFAQVEKLLNAALNDI